MGDHLCTEFNINNGTYAVANHKKVMEQKKQCVALCRISSHHQHGEAENCMEIICDPARRMLTGAMHRCPEAITQALWTCAVSLAVGIRNKSKLDVNGVLLIEKISEEKTLI